MDDVQVFYEWIKEQHMRDDAVGWFSKWCSAVKGRVPDEVSDDLSSWQSIVERKASKPHKAVALGCLTTAWKEWMAAQGKLSNRTMKVKSTLGILERSAKSFHGTEESDQSGEEISVSTFEGPVAHISVERRVSLPMGVDWVRVGYSLTLPCYPEEIDAVAGFAERWVDNRLETEIDKLQAVDGDDESDTSSHGPNEFRKVVEESKDVAANSDISNEEDVASENEDHSVHPDVEEGGCSYEDEDDDDYGF